MKKTFYTTFILAVLIASKSFAGAPLLAAEKHEFKSTSNDINFEAERIKGEVVFHFYSQYFKEYEQVIIERGGDLNTGFIGCKAISIAEQKIQDGNYFQNADRYPLPANKDSYYRIKTIAKDGVTKTYPPIQIVALH
jgi:hypothetical protein